MENYLVFDFGGTAIKYGILNERGLSGTRPLFFTDNGEYKMQKGR